VRKIIEVIVASILLFLVIILKIYNKIQDYRFERRIKKRRS